MSRSFKPKIKRNTIYVPGGKLKVIQVTPTHIREKIPVFIGQGWATYAEPVIEIMKDLADRGRSTLAVDDCYGLTGAHPTKRRLLRIVSPIPQLRRSFAVLETLHTMGIKRVDAIGHSAGGPYIAAAAAMRPKLFRNTVFTNSAGLLPNDMFLCLMYRYFSERYRHRGQSKAAKAQARQQWLRAIKGGPITLYSEASAIASSRIHRLLKRLKRRGVGVMLVHAVDDQTFPWPRIEPTINHQHVHGILTPPGGHDAFYQPGFAKTLDSALTLLEERSQEADAPQPYDAPQR